MLLQETAWWLSLVFLIGDERVIRVSINAIVAINSRMVGEQEVIADFRVARIQTQSLRKREDDTSGDANRRFGAGREKKGPKHPNPTSGNKRSCHGELRQLVANVNAL